jgi:hypothetical protein
MKSAETAVRNLWARYGIALVAGALFTIPVLVGVIGLADSLGLMPPPLISNNLCVDEKLAFMRKNKPGEVNLLVVGSSSAMRHFNSPEAVRFDPALRPYNAGMCAVTVAQSAHIIAWLTHRLSNVRRVLLLTSSLEFGDCRDDAGPSINFRDADRFVFGDTSPLTFYLKSFDTSALLHNAVGLRRRRTDMTRFDSVVLNGFGDAPVEPSWHRSDWYLKPELDKQCFESLRQTARMLDGQGIQFAVVESPMDPTWKEEFDRSGAVAELTRSGIRQALTGTHAVLIEDHAGFSPAAFYDAEHIRASETSRFTRSVLAQLENHDLSKTNPSH